MYFPYLRGKQFELLALKEVCPLLCPTNKIHPIIEPVKESFQALERSLYELCCNNIQPTIIANPYVGEIEKSSALKLNTFLSEFVGSNRINIGFIINANHDIDRAINLIDRFYNDDIELTLIYLNEFSGDRTKLKSFLSDYNISYNVTGESNPRNFLRLFEPSSLVTLSDPFPKAEKNADYARNHDSLFTEEHIYYKPDGFIGFSDYLTIGEYYSDSGFLPYAVAIHLTYSDKSNEEIRLRHFVSDSNDDDSNVAGKFSEALNKLIEFTSAFHNKTKAIREFEELHAKEHYPGLGYIKKLSILNHLELVNNLLQ